MNNKSFEYLWLRIQKINAGTKEKIANEPDNLEDFIMHLRSERKNRDKFGETYLHKAAKMANGLQIIRFFTMCCSQHFLTVLSNDSQCPLHLMAANQDITSIFYIKGTYGELYNEVRGPHGQTMAHAAAANQQDPGVFRYIVEDQGAACLEVEDNNLDTVVHVAAEFQNVEAMKLIKKQLGAIYRILQGRDCRRPLHAAALNPDSAVFKFIADEMNESYLELSDSDGRTAGHLAAQYQEADVVKLLENRLGARYRKTADNAGRLPIHYAAMNQRSPEALKHIVNTNGGGCLQLPDNQMETAIHLSAKNQDATVMQFIKEKFGSNYNDIKGAYDRRAIHYAAQNSNSLMVNWMVNDLGHSCLQIEDKHGINAITIIEENKNTEAIKFVREILNATNCST